jgi:hypothetical protein
MSETPTPTPRPRRARAPRRDENASQSSHPSRSGSDSRGESESSPPGGTGGTPGTRSPGGRTPPLQKRLEDFLATPAMAYAAAGDQYGAWIIASRTPAMAEAWYELSKQNAAVKRNLERLLTGGAWGGVVLNSAAVLLPLLSHHGVIPIEDPFTPMFGHPPEHIAAAKMQHESRRVPPAAFAGASASGGDAPEFAPDMNGHSDDIPGVVTVGGRDRSVTVE